MPMFYASVRKNKQQVSAHYLEADEKHNVWEHSLILIDKLCDALEIVSLIALYK